MLSREIKPHEYKKGDRVRLIEDLGIIARKGDMGSIENVMSDACVIRFDNGGRNYVCNNELEPLPLTHVSHFDDILAILRQDTTDEIKATRIGELIDEAMHGYALSEKKQLMRKVDRLFAEDWNKHEEDV